MNTRFKRTLVLSAVSAITVYVASAWMDKKELLIEQGKTNNNDE